MSEYADQVTVQVRFKQWVGADDADEFWLIEANGAAWSKDWLTEPFPVAEGWQVRDTPTGMG